MTPVVGVLIREGGRPVSASEVCSSSFLRLSTTYGCPGSRGVRDPGECDASHWETCRLDGLKLWRAPLIYSDRTFLLIDIRAKAAPAPQFRRFHQTTLHQFQVSNPARPGAPSVYEAQMSALAILSQPRKRFCCSRFQSHDLGTLHRSAVCRIDSEWLVC